MIVPVNSVFDFRCISDSVGTITFAMETIETPPSGRPGAIAHRIRAINFSAALGWSSSWQVDTGNDLLSDVALGDLVVSSDRRRWLTTVEKYESLPISPNYPRRAFVMVASALGDGAWESPVAISTPTNTDEVWNKPQLAVDGTGRVLAAWIKYELSGCDIHINSHDTATGWSSDQNVTRVNGTSMYQGDQLIAVNESGAAVLAWTQGVGGGHVAFAKHFDPASGWGDATAIQFVGNRTVASSAIQGNISIGIDALGTVIAGWNEGVGYNDTYLSTRSPDGIWTKPAMISQQVFGSDGLVGTSGDIHLAENANGQALFVWRQNDGSGTMRIWSAFRQP